MTMTKHKLNTSIAHLLGYTDINASTPPWAPLPGQTRTTAVHPETKATNYLPDWVGDVGAAMSLLSRYSDWFLDRELTTILECCIYKPRPSPESVTVNSDDRPLSEVIARCVYEYETGQAVEVAADATGGAS